MDRRNFLSCSIIGSIISMYPILPAKTSAAEIADKLYNDLLEKYRGDIKDFNFSIFNDEYLVNRTNGKRNGVYAFSFNLDDVVGSSIDWLTSEDFNANDVLHEMCKKFNNIVPSKYTDGETGNKRICGYHLGQVK